VTNDGRTLVGTLHGFDQLQNCILTSSQERVFSADEEPQVPPFCFASLLLSSTFLLSSLCHVPCVISLISMICIDLE